jgi:hypothetical protein
MSISAAAARAASRCSVSARLVGQQAPTARICIRFIRTAGRNQHAGGPQGPSGPIGVEPVRGLRKPVKPNADEKCGDPVADEDEEDMVQMVDAKTGEWGGPTRGGTAPEPTRFGDWERKGRCTDF